MYRYQHFSARRFWTVEYGDAEKNPEAFGWLSDYSPLHNVDAGVESPAARPHRRDWRPRRPHALTRVRRRDATLGQWEFDDPILERIETRAGHGMGKPTSKLIDEAADVCGFMLHHLGPEVPSSADSGPES